jgi:aminoglycoside phosphotransferase (APT) family kinase protein
MLTPALASSELATVGIAVAPEAISLIRRDVKWVAQLPGDRAAWFAATDEGSLVMTRERRVLRLIERRCRFSAPRVVIESADGAVDVRVTVPGAHDVDAVFERVRNEPGAAERVGAAIGNILADLHSNIGAEDVAGWLPSEPSWPEPRGWIEERLPRVVPDRTLQARASAVMQTYERQTQNTAQRDRALVHSDLGFHNAIIDPESLDVRGVFDWEAACWADRHLDFRYLIVDDGRTDLLDAAAAAYEAATGCSISHSRVYLYNAACAITYLAFRDGVSADQLSCGRTLAEDIAWTQQAIARAERG